MSEILDIANEMAKDLFKVGAMDEISTRVVDVLCLPKKRRFQPEDIYSTHSHCEPCESKRFCRYAWRW